MKKIIVIKNINKMPKSSKCKYVLVLENINIRKVNTKYGINTTIVNSNQVPNTTKLSELRAEFIFGLKTVARL